MTDTLSSPTQCPNLIAVASGKGGVGKTWFAVTLSHTLAQAGKKVLLFDGDLGLANVDIQLGLMPKLDLASVIDGEITLPMAILPFEQGRFDILAGRSGSGNLASLSSAKVTQLRNDLLRLAPAYDYIIIDLGAGVERPTRQMAAPAGVVLVVITDEPTSLTDAYAFIKLMRAANPRIQPRIVVNLAANIREGQKTYETIRKACQSFLNYAPPLAGVIRRDTHVREAIRIQTPLLTRSPACEAAQDVAAIAAQL